MELSFRKYWAYIARLNCIVAIRFHELESSIHMALIVPRRSRCFVMHYHLHTLGFCIISDTHDIKIRIRRYKIEHMILFTAKPVFPSYIPSFHQYSVEFMFRSKIYQFFYVFCVSTVCSIWLCFAVVGNAKLYGWKIIGVAPGTFTSYHFPPHTYIFYRLYPICIFYFTRLIQIID